MQSALAKASPEGIDCFFDNVGGPSSALIVNNHMRNKGRVVVVGVISEYNYIGEDHKTARVPPITMSVLVKVLRGQCHKNLVLGGTRLTLIKAHF